MKKYNLFIDGQWIAPQAGEYIDCVNPSTGEVIAQIAKANQKDTQGAISAAKTAFKDGQWSKLSVKERGQRLVKIADLIREYAKELGELESKNTGKTIKHTTFIDVPTCAETFEYFGKIEKELSDRKLNISAPVDSSVSYEPIGVVGAIAAWNYPLIFFGWKVAPALIVGNSVVYKPSSLASVAVVRLAEIIQDVLPRGVFNIITGSSEAGKELAQSADVDMLTFTGGTKTGQEIMKNASSNTKRLCLELGGKSPNIVFADCDMDVAVGGAMSAIFMNQGQMCVAGSRLLLEDKIYDEFLEKLSEKTKSLNIGDASDATTEFGPLTNTAHRDAVLSFIEKGKKEGARLVCGGKIPDGIEFQKGAFLEPTIFADVKNSMAIAQEEIFGPVLSVIKFSSQDEAIEIANDSKYGLAAMVWTKDKQKAEEVSRQLRCGTVWVNTYGGFYNEAPFGGYKQSGFGRELGVEGLLEYAQAKHICRDATPGGRSLVTSWF
ncbi:MAG: aldehyde dehydrogenase family protein [Candidatus Aceula meridiana]|nr:aldehyde dehydrogenase family protein [Candidatus Aceula meridiana]